MSNALHDLDKMVKAMHYGTIPVLLYVHGDRIVKVDGKVSMTLNFKEGGLKKSHDIFAKETLDAANTKRTGKQVFELDYRNGKVAAINIQWNYQKEY